MGWPTIECGSNSEICFVQILWTSHPQSITRQLLAHDSNQTATRQADKHLTGKNKKSPPKPVHVRQLPERARNWSANVSGEWKVCLENCHSKRYENKKKKTLKLFTSFPHEALVSRHESICLSHSCSCRVISQTQTQRRWVWSGCQRQDCFGIKPSIVQSQCKASDVGEGNEKSCEEFPSRM